MNANGVLFSCRAEVIFVSVQQHINTQSAIRILEYVFVRPFLVDVINFHPR